MIQVVKFLDANNFKTLLHDVVLVAIEDWLDDDFVQPNTRRRSNFKRDEIPKFFGDRALYLEFKLTWISLVEADYMDDPMWEVSLSQLLKKNVENKAKAKQASLSSLGLTHRT